MRRDHASLGVGDATRQNHATFPPSLFPRRRRRPLQGARGARRRRPCAGTGAGGLERLVVLLVSLRAVHLRAHDMAVLGRHERFDLVLGDPSTRANTRIASAYDACLARCGTSSATAPRPAQISSRACVLLRVSPPRHRPARRLAVADDAVVEIVEEACILSREVELGALQHRAPLEGIMLMMNRSVETFSPSTRRGGAAEYFTSSLYSGVSVTMLRTLPTGAPRLICGSVKDPKEPKHVPRLGSPAPPRFAVDKSVHAWSTAARSAVATADATIPRTCASSSSRSNDELAAASRRRGACVRRPPGVVLESRSFANAFSASASIASNARRRADARRRGRRARPTRAKHGTR